MNSLKANECKPFSNWSEGLWKIVITVYEEAETIEEFLGNKVPRNARVLLLDENSRVLFSHDRGFSVGALNKLLKKIGEL